MPIVCIGKNKRFDDIKNDIYANLPTKSLNPVGEMENRGIEAEDKEERLEERLWEELTKEGLDER